MPTLYQTKEISLNTIPIVILKGTPTKQFIVAKLQILNTDVEPIKLKIKFNNTIVYKDIRIEINPDKPTDIDVVSKYKINNGDKLEITAMPLSLYPSATGGEIGGFPWYTYQTGKINVVKCILSYVEISS